MSEKIMESNLWWSDSRQTKSACKEGTRTRARGVKASKLKMHINSSQIESILNPMRGRRDELRRRGVEPTNHSKQNRKAIKKMSEINALKKKQQKEEVKESWMPLKRPSTSGHLSKKAESKKVEDGKCDFLVKNIKEASSKKPVVKKPEKNETCWRRKEGYGEIPRYLQMRKIELAAAYAAKQSVKEAKLLPEGMRLLEEGERVEALGTILKNKEEVEQKLKGLPLVVETPSLVSLKNSLEKRLCELEDTERIFSRSKVLVKI